MSGSSGKGSIWRKWDLQTQPIKGEWLPKLEDPDILIKIKQRTTEFVKEANNKSVDVIAITDHNCGKAIDYALENEYGINIMPGVELDTKEGWHLLVIFSPEYRLRLHKQHWSEAVDTFLQNICGIAPPFFNTDNTIKKVEETTKQLIIRIWNEGIGLPIFAHCCSNDGFFQRGDDQSRKEILKTYAESKAFFCFEIKERYDQIEEINRKIKDLSGKELSIPILSSTDADKASDVGNCFTWIKADPHYEGLKQIIYEPDLRVRIHDETPSESETYSRINNLQVMMPDEVKIKDEESGETTDFCLSGKYAIEFSNNLTCIIGGRGSGKSTLLHLIYNKWIHQDLNKFTEVNSPLNSLSIEHQPLGKIGQLTNCEVPSETEFFFQNEIERNAKNIESMSKLISVRLSKLSALDGGQSLNSLNENWVSDRERIKDLISSYDRVSEIDYEIQKVSDDIRTLREQIAIIKSEEYRNFQEGIKEVNERITDFSNYKNEYQRICQAIDDLITEIDMLHWNEDKGATIIESLKETVSKHKAELEKNFREQERDYENAGYDDKLANLRRELKEYLERKGLSPENVEELTDANLQIKNLENRLEQLKRDKLPHEKVYNSKDEIIKNLKNSYDIFKNRYSEVTEILAEKLAGLKISEKKIQFNLHVDYRYLKSNIVDFIKESIHDDTVLRTDFIEKVVFATESISSFVENKDTIKECVNTASPRGKHTQVLQELLNDEVFLEKLYLRIVRHFYDIKNIQVQTKLGAKLLKNTSFGERCGIVIAIVLVAGTNPITIDQPEDHLEGRYISDVLVPLIRKQKLNRQIILVTRDANVVIGSDAELIHILEVENEKTVIFSSTIENHEYRGKYIWILDGGEEAFLKRERKYNIRTAA